MTEQGARYDAGGDEWVDRVWSDVRESVKAGERNGRLDALAGEMREYYDSLVARRFTPGQALRLVESFQSMCVVLWYEGEDE